MGILKTAIKGVNAFPDIHRVNDGWHALTGSYHRVDNDDYENVYGSASKIINRAANVAPYAINEKRERVLNAVALDKTFKPNQQMSGYDFREALFGKFIVLGEALVRVHTKNDDDATPDNIIGYTFLENAVRIVSPVDGVITYTVNGKTFTDKEVIRIHGFNPNSLLDKYSPTQAAKRWSGIDDYIADYQRGFFKNGAVPAGEFIITAATPQDYKDIKAGMQNAHRGAGKNNNVVYSYRPIDANGKAQNSQIEWIPFNSDNKSLDLGAIFDQVNSKIDSAFGVPASIRGVGENNNYATAQMDARNFVENTINPLLLKVWTSFTHELNRITGGLGYAIVYDLDIPSVSYDKKVQAETHQITLTTISNALQAGFDIKSVLEAIDAPESYQSLVSGYVQPAKQDDPDVDMGNEVDDAPEEAVTKGAAKSTDPKATKVVGIDLPHRRKQEQQLEDVIRASMERQIDRAIKETKAFGDATAEEVTQFLDEMMVIIAAGMLVSGEIEYALGIELIRQAGLPTDATSVYNLSQRTINDYRGYLTNVAKGYQEQTAEAIRTILARANEGGLTRVQLQQELAGYINSHDAKYRISRLAVTETNRSMNLASIDSMKQIAEETGAVVEKGFQHDGSDTPCEYCQTILQTWIPIDQLLLPKGDVLVGVDGGIMLNDFADNDGWDVHPNGHCVPIFRVVRGE